MSLEVSIEDYSDQYIAPIIDLMGNYFKSDNRLLTTSYTRWFYAENPFGLARLVHIIEGDRWVAFMAMIPVQLARLGETVRAYYVVNVLVHPAFQGMHLFSRMITEARKRAEAEGAALMGHPNDMALNSWQRARMHFHETLQPSMVWPRPWVRGMNARPVREISQLQESSSVLTEIALNSVSWRVVATPAYLDWRYLRHPANTYDVQAILAKGALAGVQITKWVYPGARLLIDQFVYDELAKCATTLLPTVTICFWPESITQEMSGAVWALPWKKRISFFFTHGVASEKSASVARLGLSASDF